MNIPIYLKKYYASAMILVLFWGVIFIISGLSTLISTVMEFAQNQNQPFVLLFSTGIVILLLGITAVTGFLKRKSNTGKALIRIFSGTAAVSMLAVPLQLSMPVAGIFILWLPGFSGLWILSVMLRLDEESLQAD